MRISPKQRIIYGKNNRLNESSQKFRNWNDGVLGPIIHHFKILQKFGTTPVMAYNNCAPRTRQLSSAITGEANQLPLQYLHPVITIDMYSLSDKLR